MADLLMTFIGPARDGVFASVSELVLERGGRWLDSHVRRLNGHFTGSALIEVPEERVHDVTHALENLPGLHAVVMRTERIPVPEHIELRIDLFGPDSELMIQELVRTLAGLGCVLEEMSTYHDVDVDSGEPWFGATCRVQLRSESSLDEIRSVLESFGKRTGVEIGIGEPVETSHLH